MPFWIFHIFVSRGLRLRCREGYRFSWLAALLLLLFTISQPRFGFCLISAFSVFVLACTFDMLAGVVLGVTWTGPLASLSWYPFASSILEDKIHSPPLFHPLLASATNIQLLDPVFLWTNHTVHSSLAVCITALTNAFCATHHRLTMETFSHPLLVHALADKLYYSPSSSPLFIIASIVV